MTVSPQEYAKLAPVIKIKEGEKAIRYFGPNEMAAWRCKTLYSKEPSTIAWLKRIGEDDILLDVGANVGMYSIYAACMQGCNQVISIEPESQNFSILCKNIILNKLQDKVLPFCFSLSDKQEIGKLFLSKFSWDGGGSCHSFNEEVGFNLEYREAPFKQGSIGITLDQAIDCGSIPVPDYIKIDVDGFEHKVISGSLNTLKNKKVRSISIELNLNLREHLKTIEVLRELGFDYNEDQATKSLRKEGPFKDCGEFIFDRIDTHSILPLLQTSALKGCKQDGLNNNTKAQNSTSELNQRTEIKSQISLTATRIKNSPMTTESPFPYMILNDIFDLDFYKTICKMFPSKSYMTPISETGRTSGAYKERHILLLNEESNLNKLPTEEHIFWNDFRESLHSEAIIKPLIDKFWPWCKNRLAAAIDYAKHDLRRVEMDTLLVNDQTNYSIGPHTDAPHRLFSLLFYLPNNKDYAQHGTKFYKPKDPSFTCQGGPHYKFEQFEEIAAAEYIPNSLVAFVRTDKSFHGVPKVDSRNINRKLIITNLRLRK